MDPVRDVRVPVREELHDADEIRRVEDGGGVNLVADEMDGFCVDEIKEEIEVFPV